MALIPRFLTHNASLKVLALVGATFLWAVAPRTPQGSETLSEVPVRVQVGDPGWVVAEEPEPGRVTVRLSGPTREIIRLVREGTSVRVPVDEVSSPDTVVNLRRDWVVLSGSPGVVVEEVAPGSVRIRFEEAGSDAFPVVVRTTGQLPDDLALAAPLGVTPAVARVSGPSRILDQIGAIPTVALDLGSISGSGIMEVPLDTTGLGDVLVSPRTAAVGVRVEEAVERRLLALPVEVEGDPGFSPLLEPDVSDVLVRGAPSRMSVPAFDSIRVVVDAGLVQGMEPGESRRVPVGLVGVPDLLSARAEVDSVEVIRPAGEGEGEEPR